MESLLINKPPATAAPTIAADSVSSEPSSALGGEVWGRKQLLPDQVTMGELEASNRFLDRLHMLEKTTVPYYWLNYSVTVVAKKQNYSMVVFMYTFIQVTNVVKSILRYVIRWAKFHIYKYKLYSFNFDLLNAHPWTFYIKTKAKKYTKSTKQQLKKYILNNALIMCLFLTK